MNKIITVSRQFSSGGREFGRRLAEELGIAYYDKEVITAIAEHTSLSEDYVRQIVDRKPHNLYPITVGHSLTYVDDYAIKRFQSIFTAQDEIIKDLASKSDCLFVGRCSDYILREMNPYRIYVYATMESRVKRCLDKRRDDEDYLTEKEAKKQVQLVDKNRSKYYEYYTGYRWGDIENYDLCINSTNTNMKELVPVVAKMFK